MPLVHRAMHGEEFDGGHAQAAEVVEGWGRGKTRVRAAELWGNLGMPCGESLDVDLVDHCLVPGRAEKPVVAPRKGSLHHHALRHEGRAVARIGGARVVCHLGLVAEEGDVPGYLA